MTKRSKAGEQLAVAAQNAVMQLGSDVGVARRRRRLSQDLMAKRMQVSRQTLHRLEHGDLSVSLAVLASALDVLGLASRLERLAAPEQDQDALALDLARLPRRVRPAAQGLS